MINHEPLLEEKVKAILAKDAAVAKSKGKSPYWASVLEHLDWIPDKDIRNTVFMHTVNSMKYALMNESTTTGAVTPASYNKAMLPTIIRRVLPQVVAMKYIATRQLDMPTQVIQTFRLSRKSSRNDFSTGTQEFADASLNTAYNSNAYKNNRGGLDPFYSSAAIVDESTALAGAGATETHTVKQMTETNPLTGAAKADAPLSGSIKIYKVSTTDPFNKSLVALPSALDPTKLVLASDTTKQCATVVYSTGVITPTPTASVAGNVVALPAPGAGYKYVVDYTVNQERSKNLSEVSFAMDKLTVTAQSRKNFAQISVEAIQDLEAYTDGKIDALKELVSAMTETMALEIDQELTMAMIASAGKTASWAAGYPSGQFRGTMADWNETLVHRMNFLANDMSVDYLRGDDFFAICHPHVFNILQNTNKFRMNDLKHEHYGDFGVGAEKSGQIDSFQVSKNPYHPLSNNILLGYTSKDLAKAPYAYFPYVTYLTPPQADIMSGDIFSSVVGLQQRYAHQLLGVPNADGTRDGKFGLATLNVTGLAADSIAGIQPLA